MSSVGVFTLKRDTGFQWQVATRNRYREVSGTSLSFWRARRVATSIGASSLPTNSRTLVLSPAEAQALGLGSARVGLSSARIFGYAAKKPTSNEYYPVGVVEDEISKGHGAMILSMVWQLIHHAM